MKTDIQVGGAMPDTPQVDNEDLNQSIERLIMALDCGIINPEIIRTHMTLAYKCGILDGGNNVLKKLSSHA